MDENNKNPYAEQNYKPQKPKKPGKGFGIASMVLSICAWILVAIAPFISYVPCSLRMLLILWGVVSMCVPLAIVAVVLGIFQSVIYEKTKMADAGIVMSGILLIFVLFVAIPMMIYSFLSHF